MTDEVTACFLSFAESCVTERESFHCLMQITYKEKKLPYMHIADRTCQTHPGYLRSLSTMHKATLGFI